jgi:type II secretory pathway component GspD/PulD (secretin)
MSSPLFAQLSDGSKGRLKLDVEVQDELGIDTVSQVVQLKNIQASEIEPFIQARLSRWGAVQVNDALNMVVITDKRAKLNDLTALVRQMDTPKLKDFLRLETVSIPLNYTSPETVKSLVSAQVSKEGRLIVDKAHNALVITDLKSKIESIRRIVAQLDVFSPQVQIDAVVVEISGDTLQKAGLDLEALRTVQGSASGQISSNRSSTASEDITRNYDANGKLTDAHQSIHNSNVAGYPFWSVGGGVNLDQLFNVVNLWVNQNKARILTRTTLVTSNNETGSLSAGDKVYYRTLGSRPQDSTNTTYYNTAAAVTNLYGSANQSESSAAGGLQVRILPLIGKDDVVQLSILANLDNLTGWSPEGAPIFENRSTQSKVTLKNGETFLLSGLQKTTQVDSEKGIPVLRSILPFIFSKKTKSKQQHEIWVLLTPHIQRVPATAPADVMETMSQLQK